MRIKLTAEAEIKQKRRRKTCYEFAAQFLKIQFLSEGFLIDFISGPVSIGFTSAAAIIIATTQVKDVLGLSFQGGKFLQVWEQIFEHITETRLWDCILGFSCMAVLLILRVSASSLESKHSFCHCCITTFASVVQKSRLINRSLSIINCQLLRVLSLPDFEIDFYPSDTFIPIDQ